MPAPQVTYPEVMAVGKEGFIAESRINAQIMSGNAGGAIPPGRFVKVTSSGVAGAVTPIVDLPTLTAHVTGDLSFGFTLQDPSAASTTGENPGYVQYDQIPILREGVMWAISEDAVATWGLPVFVRFTAGGAGQTVGRVRTDADTAKAVALPGATFMGTCAAEGLIKIEYRPQQ